MAFYHTFNLKMAETNMIWGRKSTFENKKLFINTQKTTKKKSQNPAIRRRDHWDRS